MNRTDTFKLLAPRLFSEELQPWRRISDGFAPTPPIPSMICTDEAQFLHYLAQTQHGGSGAVVDLGPLFGSSTYALASGLAYGRRPGTVYSYHFWRSFPTAAPLMPEADLRVGDDLFPFFERNVAVFRERIVARRGDILRHHWHDGPISIIFIDAAKSPKLMRHIAREFFPHLVPGGFVVHQDWISAEDPWIHIAMGILGDYFEVMDSPEGGSVCFRLKRQIPKNTLSRRFFYDPDAARYLASARAALPNWHGLCVRLAEAHYQALLGNTFRAQSICREVMAHPLFTSASFDYDFAMVERAITIAERPWRARLATSALECMRWFTARAR